MDLPPGGDEITPPERLEFKVWAEHSTLRVDIVNLHTEEVQAMLIQRRVEKFIPIYQKMDQRTLAGAKAVLVDWAYRLQETGFRAVEYVGEGRWRWEGAVFG